MSNLVGTGLNQVPTNSMLGGLAYQSPDHASIKDLDLKNLSQINSEIADTAVDIFVYDTSKDSDGGAWRKRTQHTSWYNETLGTATRGTRREFPSVAVIVAETGQVTIYDGDDPDLPMWMVFNGTAGSASHNLLVSTGTFCLSALNGTVFMGALAIYVNFISEYSRGHRSTGNSLYWNGPYNGNIVERNAGKGSTQLSDKLILGGSNDVAMTVLPNAPIDSATGLPTPTIAVATDGGTSIIKDDGTVVDYTRGGSEYTGSVAFDELNDLIISWGTTLGGYRHATRITNPFVGTTTLDATYGYIASDLGLGGAAAGNTNGVVTVANSGRHFGIDFDASSGVPASQGNHDDRVDFLHINDEDTTKSLVAFATTSYNTGWMQGGIKGAFLSDTDTTDATYTTVADDWATAGSWSKQSSISVSSTGSGTSGTLSITGNGTGSNVYFFNGISVEANTDYVVTVTFGAYNASEFYINNTTYTTANKLLDIGSQSGLTRGGHFNSGSNTFLYIQGYQVSSSATTITSLVIQKVSEIDRSVNNNGLQVFGTITKSAVATGADLVGYSGFTASTDYLVQPHNSDLAPGTNPYSVMVWVKTGTSSSDQYIFDRASGETNTRNLLQIMHSGAANPNRLQWWHRNSSGNVTDVQATDLTVADNNWHFIVAVQDGGGYFVYVDGVKSSVGGGTIRDIDNSNSPDMYIGVRNSLNNAMTGSMALFRYSLSCPSPEQIKKIYEDEKVLFQENAKATLYGSSDAVTALAYDDATELLHVGTSSGRSDFRGLRRINNTTTAVTTAISASKEFVAEQ